MIPQQKARGFPSSKSGANSGRAVPTAASTPAPSIPREPSRAAGQSFPSSPPNGFPSARREPSSSPERTSPRGFPSGRPPSRPPSRPSSRPPSRPTSRPSSSTNSPTRTFPGARPLGTSTGVGTSTRPTDQRAPSLSHSPSLPPPPAASSSRHHSPRTIGPHAFDPNGGDVPDDEPPPIIAAVLHVMRVDPPMPRALTKVATRHAIRSTVPRLVAVIFLQSCWRGTQTRMAVKYAVKKGLLPLRRGGHAMGSPAATLGAAGVPATPTTSSLSVAGRPAPGAGGDGGTPGVFASDSEARDPRSMLMRVPSDRIQDGADGSGSGAGGVDAGGAGPGTHGGGGGGGGGGGARLGDVSPSPDGGHDPLSLDFTARELDGTWQLGSSPTDFGGPVSSTGGGAGGTAGAAAGGSGADVGSSGNPRFSAALTRVGKATPARGTAEWHSMKNRLDIAATRISSLYRGHLARRRADAVRVEKGMVPKWQIRAAERLATASVAASAVEFTFAPLVKLTATPAPSIHDLLMSELSSTLFVAQTALVVACDGVRYGVRQQETAHRKAIRAEMIWMKSDSKATKTPFRTFSQTEDMFWCREAPETRTLFALEETARASLVLHAMAAAQTIALRFTNVTQRYAFRRSCNVVLGIQSGSRGLEADVVVARERIMDIETEAFKLLQAQASVSAMHALTASREHAMRDWAARRLDDRLLLQRIEETARVRVLARAAYAFFVIERQRLGFLETLLRASLTGAQDNARGLISRLESTARTKLAVEQHLRWHIAQKTDVVESAEAAARGPVERAEWAARERLQWDARVAEAMLEPDSAANQASAGLYDLRNPDTFAGIVGARTMQWLDAELQTLTAVTASTDTAAPLSIFATAHLERLRMSGGGVPPAGGDAGVSLSPDAFNGRNAPSGDRGGTEFSGRSRGGGGSGPPSPAARGGGGGGGGGGRNTSFRPLSPMSTAGGLTAARDGATATALGEDGRHGHGEHGGHGGGARGGGKSQPTKLPRVAQLIAGPPPISPRPVVAARPVGGLSSAQQLTKQLHPMRFERLDAAAAQLIHTGHDARLTNTGLLGSIDKKIIVGPGSGNGGGGGGGGGARGGQGSAAGARGPAARRETARTAPPRLPTM